MVRVSCRDIGIESCDFSCEAEKVTRLENLMLEHIRDAHPHMIAGLTYEQHKALEARIKSGIHAAGQGGEPRGGGGQLQLRVACRDLGVADCGFVAEGTKARQVEEKMFDHIRERHPELVAGLDIEQYEALEHRVKSAIVHGGGAAGAQRAA